jgi:hypothetical protein
MVRPETGLIHFYNALSGEKIIRKRLIAFADQSP